MMELAKILVPTAGPVPARMNADYIMNLAKRLSASVYVIHIRDLQEDREPGVQALEIFEEAGLRWNVPVKTELLVGDVVENIIEVAQRERVDFIVMGSSQDRIAANWIVAQVLRATKIPIFLIPFGIDELME